MHDFIKKANSQKRMDLIVFHELANTDYVKGKMDREFGREYIKKAEKISGPFTEVLAVKSRKSHSFLLTGAL
jgi:predicted amidohydrolase